MITQLLRPRDEVAGQLLAVSLGRVDASVQPVHPRSCRLDPDGAPCHVRLLVHRIIDIEDRTGPSARDDAAHDPRPVPRPLTRRA
ncbi:hypothetical protein GCM10011354_21810 [Egicoccus halophilus]|uniref:Uncharacterized protein n=1 Tax=Egicoccus halophilus TaxID=1670830 RepID=A0A8J3A8W0_9ACTN|nr:hypothetical protein GCM10011354_21810 [Egicoccus halophilus]